MDIQNADGSMVPLKDDGLKYMQLLLDQTDEDFDNYLNLWKEKQKKSKEIVQKYDKDQFETFETGF